jgi:hypothetical protein
MSDTERYVAIAEHNVVVERLANGWMYTFADGHKWFSDGLQAHEVDEMAQV